MIKKTPSWILRNKITKEVIMETYDIRKVNALNTSKYEAVPILSYLYQVNAEIKAGSKIDNTPECGGPKKNSWTIITASTSKGE